MGRATRSIGLIGAGKMATALAGGMVSAGFADREQIVAADPLAAAASAFARQTGGKIAKTNRELVSQSDVVVLAVKPQVLIRVLEDLKGDLQERHLIVSIAAGVPLARLEQSLPSATRLVRVMPNTPCLVGAGASAFCGNRHARSDDLEFVRAMLATVGVAKEVSEPLLDAVTGLSGSGPAYAYQMIEALSDGGVRAGLPRELATEFAAQTLLGAAKMVLETGQHPGALKDAVTSPGGTTITGLHAMEQGGVRAALMNAVLAATQRSRELGG